MPFEIIFIDGVHEYTAAYHDIAFCAELLTANGLMLMHDVGRASAETDANGTGGVRKALYDYGNAHPHFYASRSSSTRSGPTRAASGSCATRYTTRRSCKPRHRATARIQSVPRLPIQPTLNEAFHSPGHLLLVGHPLHILEPGLAAGNPFLRLVQQITHLGCHVSVM